LPVRPVPGVAVGLGSREGSRGFRRDFRKGDGAARLGNCDRLEFRAIPPDAEVSSSFRGTLMSTNMDGADGIDGKGCGATSVFSMTAECEGWIWGGESIIMGSLDWVVVVWGGEDNFRSSHRKTSSSSNRALEIGWAVTACRVFWGEARFLPGVFTRSTKELASCQKGKPRGDDGSLLLR
jgi:hypothetical protein